MKKYSKLIISLLVLCVFLSACGGASNDETKATAPEKHILDFKEEYNEGDHLDDEYYQLLDFYNMESSGSLLMIPHFETYQQHLSYGCGPSAAYMVLNYLDKEKAANYNEDKIAEICGSVSGPGTSAGQIAEFFEKEIGWDCIYHMSHAKEFADYSSFIDSLVKWNLEDGKPIIVDWNIGGGHWTVIIGFDDMGTATTSDDVLIFADSSDNADNYRDGYNVYSAVRFFRQWKEFNAFDGEKVYQQQYIVVDKALEQKSGASGSANTKEVKAFAPEKHVLNADTTEEFGAGDHPDSKYFKINDYYNMQSTDTRLMIPHFETYQQHLSYGCGPSSAYMVLNYFDKEKAANYSEDKIAEICGSTGGGVGTSAGQLADFFKNELGWEVDYHMDHNKIFASYDQFVDVLVKWNLEEGKPIMVDWSVSSGHWTVIIGFDDRGTKTNIDDVIIFADPSDAYNHYQDGYNVFSARRFYGMWRESTAFDGVKPYAHQYLVVTPPEKK